MDPPKEQNPQSPTEAKESAFAKLLSSRWLLSLLPIVASALYLRYLNLIGRPDLFLNTFSNTAGIVAFVSVFLVLISLVLFVFVSPSLFFATMSNQIRQEVKGETADRLPKAPLALGIGMLVSAMCFVRGWTAAVLIAGPTIGVAIHFAYVAQKGKTPWRKTFASKDNKEEGWRWRLCSYALVVWFSGFMTTFSMIVSLTLVTVDDKSWFASVMVAGILALAALLSLFPGTVYSMLAGRTKTPPAVPVAGFLAMSVFLVYLALLAAPAKFDHLLERAAVMIGLRIDSPQRYMLEGERWDVSMLNDDGWKAKAEKQGVSFDALVPFAFADWIILCPTDLKDSDALKKEASSRCLTAKRDGVLQLPSLQSKAED